MQEYYLEYRILKNRLGLLGDVCSIFGMLGINIKRISSIPPDKRAFLLEVPNAEYLTPLKSTLGLAEFLEVLELHPPTYMDLLTLRYGRKLVKEGLPAMFTFSRSEAALLVDFLGQTINNQKKPLIGIQGPPRVGKTEVAIAACVHANRRWLLFSSTFLRQVAQEKLDIGALTEDTVMIIDALTSFFRAGGRHKELLWEVMKGPQPKIIEHPHVFLQESGLKASIFTLLVHLKRNGGKEEEGIDPQPFTSFDLS